MIADDFSCFANNASDVVEGEVIMLTCLVYYYGPSAPDVHWFLNGDRVDAVVSLEVDSDQRFVSR